MTIEQGSEHPSIIGTVKPEVRAGNIVECQLSAEQLAEIDRQIALLTGPELEELKAIRRAALNVDPLTFQRRIG